MTKLLYVLTFTLGAVFCYLFLAAAGASARPDPNVGFKDWVTVFFAIAALLASLGALYFNWRKAKQDTFLNIHQQLIALDIQEGRRILFQKITSPEAASQLLIDDPDDYQKVNRALAMYDVLGLYVKRRYVFKSWVLEEWGANLSKAREPGRHFINHRKANGVPSLWGNFDKLSLEASILHQK